MSNPIPSHPDYPAIEATYLSLPNTPSFNASYPSPPFILLLDNVLTKEECLEYLHRATSSNNGVFDEAGVNTGDGSRTQKILKEARNCGRIILKDEQLAGVFLERIKPWLEDVGILGGKRAKEELEGFREQMEDEAEMGKVLETTKDARSGKEEDWVGIIGTRGRGGQKWRLTRLDPSLRFLQYTSGNYFRPHADQNNTHLAKETGRQRDEISFITFHLYLSDVVSENESEGGGATRIWTAERDEWVDVVPKMGRVMLFQQRGVLHSGEEVKGLKVSVRTDVLYEKVVEGDREWEEC